MAANESAQQKEHQQQQQQQRSSAQSLNLSSNNPFRNRAVSPSQGSPVSPFDDPPIRPMSRNPFLDPALTGKATEPDLISLAPSTKITHPEKGSVSPTAEELFDALTLDDDDKIAKKPPPVGDTRADAVRSRGQPGKSGMPPRGERRGPSLGGHRMTHSQEEALRAKKPVGLGGGRSRGDASSRSPARRPDRRPRRNSESSVVSSDKALTDEEKKIREMRRRERERRHRERRETGDKKPVNRKLDVIDQLDATSIYGTGLFHHDGPFDALNPHRNRKGSSRAPMKAFPKDSLNNSIGGMGPLTDRPNHAAFMGNNDDEAFKEWSKSAKERASANGYSSKHEIPVFDPTSRGAILHGDQSMGLGTSTFLEGTPAARAAIVKLEEEQRAAVMANEGLQRKKSLAQRIRNINRGPRDFSASGAGGGGRMTNPDGVYRRSPGVDGASPTMHSAGTSMNERNPFFAEYETGKGGDEGFSVLRKTDTTSSAGGMASPTSPSRGAAGLERRATADSVHSVSEEQQQAKQPSGLLARVRSLKGGRRTRPVPPGVDNNLQG